VEWIRIDRLELRVKRFVSFFPLRFVPHCISSLGEIVKRARVRKV